MIPKQQNEPSGSTWLMDYRCLRLRAAKQPSPPRDLLCLGMMPFVDFLATFFWTKWWILAPQSPPQRVSMFCNYWFGYGSIPINTIFSGMNIHLPAILGFTRYQGFDPSPFSSVVHESWPDPDPFDLNTFRSSRITPTSSNHVGDDLHTIILKVLLFRYTGLHPVLTSRITIQVAFRTEYSYTLGTDIGVQFSWTSSIQSEQPCRYVRFELFTT